MTKLNRQKKKKKDVKSYVDSCLLIIMYRCPLKFLQELQNACKAAIELIWRVGTCLTSPLQFIQSIIKLARGHIELFSADPSEH